MRNFIINLVNIIIIVLWVGCVNDRTSKIAIQPFDNFNQKLSDTIAASIRKTYNIDTYVLSNKPLPPNAFINTKSPRYRADRLIKILKDEKPDSVDYIIGLTDKDISFTKRDKFGNIKEPASKYSDWGIFGLGYRPGVSCVISTFRLRNPSEDKFIERVKKVSIHEVGHNYGLKHCDSELCVMRDAVETINTIDNVKTQLCDRCKRKIE